MSAAASIPLAMIGLALACVCNAATSDQGTDLPLRPGELWVVQRVAVDNANPRASSIRADAPGIMYRVLRVSNDGSLRWLRPVIDVCASPIWQRGTPTTLAAQIGSTMPRGARGARARLGDYFTGLQNFAITPFTLDCGNAAVKPRGRRFGWDGWVARAGGNLVVMSLRDTAVLELQRVDAAHPLKPGLDCASTVQPSERAICASPQLAGYDLSVALAIQQRASTLDAQAFTATLTEQQHWLGTRDACHSDEACLAEAFEERLAALSQ